MYSGTVLDHFHRPRNTGPLESATHAGIAGTPGEGPYLEMWLELKEGKIVRAAYRTYGCPAAVACGSITAELVTGRTPDVAGRIEAKDVLVLLGGLPEVKTHCAELAVLALRSALSTEVAGGLSDGYSSYFDAGQATE